MASGQAPLLEVRDLRVRFATEHGPVQAVDGVSFDLEEGQTLGLVGESGSGKSVTSLALLGLLPGSAAVEARTLRYGSHALLDLDAAAYRRLRGNEIAMIFQDPMTSLNPLMTVGRQLGEVLRLHQGLGRKETRKRCAQGLDEVGIQSPERRLDQYPHELSGGMRQRVMIAMGLLCEPRVLLCDEPTTALDVTIQAQILELMADLQERRGTAILLVTHDLGVVAGTSDRVQVMYAGRMVESAPTGQLFAAPAHPYTAGLLASVPRLDGDPGERLHSIAGQPPDLSQRAPGCAFAPRCGRAVERCGEQAPAVTLSGSRSFACFEPLASPDPDATAPEGQQP